MKTMSFLALLFIQVVLGSLSDVSIDVQYTGETIVVDPALFQEHHGIRYHKTTNKTPISFQFTLENAGNDPISIDTRETPLSRKIKSNPFPDTESVVYLGMIADVKGPPGKSDIMTIDAGEVKTVMANFEHLAFAEGADAGITFEFSLVNVNEDAEKLVMPSTTVPLTAGVKLLDHDMMDSKSERESKVGEDAEFDENIVTGSDGIPYYDPQCVDVPENTGYTWNSGGVVPCDDLANTYGLCTDSSVALWCPVSCGNCADYGEDWSKPNVLKESTLGFDSSCESHTITMEGVTKTDKEWILEAEEKKQELCATIMWHIENRSGDFETMYVKWFGGDATATDDRYVRLRDGFVKICSVQGYNYHCNPEGDDAGSCPFEATLSDGTSYAEDSSQIDAIDDRQNILDNYRSIGGTSAWVWTDPSVDDRRIHICPIIFFLSMDVDDDTSDLSSRVGTVFHELAHFTDMGDTGDYSYSDSVMLAGAAAYPDNGDWMGNSANWDNFSEDIAQFAMNWNDFCNEDDCSSSSDVDLGCGVGEDAPACDGVCGSTAVVDECGVCDGSGVSGCDNVCGSTAVVDECGVCGGSGISSGACDCQGNVDAGCGCGVTCTDTDADAHFVSKGKADDTSTAVAQDDEIYAVRCASDVDRSSDGWRIKSGCSIWFESDVWTEGCVTKSWSDAEAFCTTQGGRLPTLDEIENNCVQGSGCQYDSALIWSSTASTTTVVACASHDDCGGETPFCYDGLCDTCDQCQNCEDGVDGTCGPCGATTSGDTCVDEEHFVSKGKADDTSTVLAQDDEIYAVRCASDVDRSSDGWRIKSHCSIWFESDVWTEGCVTKSWLDAESFCTAQGGRLPTLDEIENNCVQGSGCQYDSALIWSSTSSTTLETKLSMKNIIQETLKAPINFSIQGFAIIGALSMVCFAKSFLIQLRGKHYQEVTGEEEEEV